MTSSSRTRALALSALPATLALVAACGTSPATPAGEPSASGAAATEGSGATGAAVAGADEKEVASITPRVVISYDGGLATIDTADGSVVGQTDHPGFLRLANAGDGRHVMVTDSDVFRVHDAGIEAQKHGDHMHYRQATPALTEVVYEAPHAGHVVTHEGLTTLFSDGTGAISIIDSAKIATPGAPTEHATTDTPHHGVAFELADGSLLTTQGTDEARSTIQVKKGAKVVAQTTDCPGVHGEAVAAPTAKGDVAVFGCENGPVVLRDGAFHKVAVNDAYSRSGNLAGSHGSPIVLGDYKVDKDADLERPTRVALIDTRKASLSLVELGSPYWFRSLARGPEGEALVLTYDGSLNVIDPTTGTISATVPAIAPWQEKDDWQLAGPAVKVAGSTAYVTDAENKKLVLVDLTADKVVSSFDLPHTPVEMAVVDGSPEAPATGGGASAGTESRENREGHEGHAH